VRLEDQDRARWDRAQIAAGAALVEQALRAGSPGPYVLQAAIAALHAQAPRADATDWPQIAALYGLLLRAQPTPVVELNRAVAVAMAEGPEQGLSLIDALEARGDLAEYHWVSAARADLLARLGRDAEAVLAYERALSQATNEAERRFLAQRLRGLRGSPPADEPARK
jgi:RNA polymerase sigma-70 factor (ECF subfamily)